jgi:REP element-mobilizing transposase RayT
MPKGLRRFHGGGERHFITCSCYRRQPFLGSARRRDVFLQILEQVRRKFDFVVWGYVVMPEHFHLLVSEPRNKSLSRAMQVLKQRRTRGQVPGFLSPVSQEAGPGRCDFSRKKGGRPAVRHVTLAWSSASVRARRYDSAGIMKKWLLLSLKNDGSLNRSSVSVTMIVTSLFAI